MKVTVEISDSEMREIRSLAGERKKGPAIRKVVVDALMLQRRRAIAEKFISGKWGANIEDFEESKSRSRKAAEIRAKAWRK
jgi:hypothetical protein